MRKKEASWAIVILVMMILAYVVPYTVLRNVDAWYGSFLFWNLFAIVIIIVNYFITVDWSE